MGLTLKLYGEVDVGAYFNLKFSGKFDIYFDNILNFKKRKVFFLGPVPVIIDPYFKLFAHIDILPISIEAGIRCQYKERREYGYRVCKGNGCKSGPIKTRKVLANGCTKKFGLGDPEQNAKERCPVQEVGFDVKLNVQVLL